MTAGASASATLRRDAIDHTGKRYGELVVLGFGGRRYTPNGTPRTLWLCRCDCGAETVVEGRQLQIPAGTPGSVRRCRACGLQRIAAIGRSRSVQLSDGRSIADVAAESGIDLNTVYRRWARGWPVERLGDPVQPKGARRFTRSPRLPCGSTPRQREATL